MIEIKNYPIYIFLLLCILASCGTESIPTFTISTSASPSEGGSVSHSPSETSQDEGTSISFQATPNDGYNFVRWEGDLISTNNPSSLVLNKDVLVTAVFEKKSYTFTINIDGEGVIEEEIIQAKTDYEHGSLVRLTPIPDTGWEFMEWTGDVNSNANPLDVSATSELNLTAIFERQQFDLNITTIGGGQVQSSVVYPKTAKYPFGSQVTLTANPNESKEFKEWIGDISGSINPTTFTLDSSMSVTGVFQPKTLSVDVNVLGNGEVSGNDITYPYGSIVRLQAVPFEDFGFYAWSGDIESEQQELEFTITNDVNLVVEFKEQHDVIFNKSGVGDIYRGTNLLGDTLTVLDGEKVALTAVESDSDYLFDSWSGSVEETLENSIEFTAYSDFTLDVSFPFYKDYKLKDFEGNEYSITKINNLFWMAENLRSKKLNQGSGRGNDITFIGPEYTTNWSGYYVRSAVTNVNGDELTFEDFGLLYKARMAYSRTWLCPPGWELPDVEDVERLLQFLDSNGYDARDLSSNNESAWAFSGNTDALDFSAVGAGIRTNGRDPVYMLFQEVQALAVYGGNDGAQCVFEGEDTNGCLYVLDINPAENTTSFSISGRFGTGAMSVGRSFRCTKQVKD